MSHLIVFITQPYTGTAKLFSSIGTHEKENVSLLGLSTYYIFSSSSLTVSGSYNSSI
jgi:hypothetical protein